MVSAELIHNPYLLETNVLFNGREPKVNSAIEKFGQRPLVEWVDEVPSTFRDEMNGLDFDLYFSGTNADYEKLLKAFEDQGIAVLDDSPGIENAPSNDGMGDHDVRSIYVDSFEDVETKRREIEDLISWLDTHRNRWFDYDEFMMANSDSLDASVPYIIVNDSPIQLELPHVSVETVDSARHDLARTDLEDTPILFMVNPRNRMQFRDELAYSLSELDVKQGQLFFCIHPTMNRDRVIRVISDLGVDEPQVVERPDDAKVIQYLDDYPSMEYVRRSIGIFRRVSNELGDILSEVDAESEVKSTDRGRKIARFDSEIEGFRNARSLICGTNPFNSLDGIVNSCKQFEDRVLSWRNRKTGVTGNDKIREAALDYVTHINSWVSILEADIVMWFDSERNVLESSLSSYYKNAGTVPNFNPSVARPRFRSRMILPDLMNALTSQTGTERVAPKNDFFGLFGAGGDSGAEANQVEVASFDVWRFTARGMLIAAVRGIVEECKQELSDYHAALVAAYAQQLDALIEDSLEGRQHEMAMLSDEDRMLEEDKGWLSEFEERLFAIERN